MKYLVTGGAGFIGSHLIEELILSNHSVLCLDDFSTGKSKNLDSIRNQVEIVDGDIRDPVTVGKIIQDIDYVFHLAAQISVNRSVREPQYDASVNINGFINLLENIKNSSVKRIVYVSTGGAIYGEPPKIPASENTTEEPISPYGLSKLVGEKYLEWYHKTYGLSYAIIRPANIYGERQDPLGEAGVISIFLGNLIKNKPCEIFGDGTDTRDYVYVKDLVELCIKAMNSHHADIFNAGSAKETNLLELVDIIEHITELKIQRKFSPPRPGDVKHISIDSSKAAKLLKWTPSTTLIEGIRRTWDWFSSDTS